MVDFLKGMLALQFAMCISALLNIPILRQVVGFVYLAFLPGLIIIKLLKIDTGSNIENALFAVGLSIAFIMFFGLMINTLLPVFGVTTPLSPLPLGASLTTLLLVLFVIAYRRTKNSSKLNTNGFRFSIAIPLLLSIPFATILGAQIVNIKGNSSILLFLVLVICAAFLCSLSRRLVPPRIFPIVILVTSFFLLFQISLSSNFLVGWDVHTEYYFAKLTSINSRWDSSITHQYNGMLSITILPVIFSDFLGFDIQGVFKVIYPLIFCLVPLGLFKVYQKKTNSTVALLSVFFFMATETFYVQMLGLARQMIAELFVVVLMLLIVEDRISLSKRRLLFLIFGAALVVSHYALSYIFMAFLVVALVLSKILGGTDRSFSLVSGRIMISYLVMIFFWYILVSPASFGAVINVFSQIWQNIISETSVPGIAGSVPQYLSPLHSISSYLFYGMQLLIIIGIFGLVFKHERLKFGSEFSSMSMASMFLLIMCIFVPSFASSLNLTRFYHLAQFFLAPFCVLGGLTIMSQLSNIGARVSRRMLHFPKVTRPGHGVMIIFLSLILVFYFLFQSGFIYQVANDIPTSISLSRSQINKWPPSLNDLYIDWPEFRSAIWLSGFVSNQSKIYIDFGVKYLTSYALIPPDRQSILSPGLAVTNTHNTYFYFGRLNVIFGKFEGGGFYWNSTTFFNTLNGTGEIYSNGESSVYYTP